jgi:dephospho-CoA kinase
LEKKENIRKLEKIIHPLVRKKMRAFTLQNRNKKLLFYEIPLLVESKLMKHFNVIIFVKARKKVRLKRFQSKGGDKKLFNLLNNKQISDQNKIKFCDHVVVNEKNLSILKKNLSVIINNYE